MSVDARLRANAVTCGSKRKDSRPFRLPSTDSPGVSSFEACRNSDGVIDASLDCFVQAAGPSMGDEGKARTAFMYLDCDRDFRVAQRELEAAWEAGVVTVMALEGALR